MGTHVLTVIKPNNRNIDGKYYHWTRANNTIRQLSDVYISQTSPVDGTALASGGVPQMHIRIDSSDKTYAQSGYTGYWDPANYTIYWNDPDQTFWSRYTGSLPR